MLHCSGQCGTVADSVALPADSVALQRTVWHCSGQCGTASGQCGTASGQCGTAADYVALQRTTWHCSGQCGTASGQCGTAADNVTQKVLQSLYRHNECGTRNFFIIPETVGATGIATHVVKKHLEAIPWEHSTDSAQNVAVLGTLHITGKYCNMKLEAWAVGIAVGTREVPGRKGLWQET
jgi:hypothetical protein